LIALSASRGLGRRHDISANRGSRVELKQRGFDKAEIVRLGSAKRHNRKSATEPSFFKARQSASGR
jgi:hypothetical protein